MGNAYLTDCYSVSQENSKVTMMYNTVLFDLDDTLTDSYRARQLALEKVFGSAGIGSPSAAELLQRHDGSPFGTTLNKIAVGHGVQADLYAEYQTELFSTPVGVITLYPGIKQMLETLRARGMKLGVVTAKKRLARVDGRSAGASQDLRDTGVAELFDTVVGSEDTALHKPDPEPVRLALATLSSAPQESFFVGDSSADIGAGRAAGCRTCLATWAPTRETGAVTGADLVAETPERLLALIFGNAAPR
jgi:pyrophosphatase PpaX